MGVPFSGINRGISDEIDRAHLRHCNLGSWGSHEFIVLAAGVIICKPIRAVFDRAACAVLVGGPGQGGWVGGAVKPAPFKAGRGVEGAQSLWERQIGAA